MATSARLLTSVPLVERERFTALAAERGVSVSHLLARLVRTAIVDPRSSLPGGQYLDARRIDRHTNRGLHHEPLLRMSRSGHQAEEA